MFSINVVIVNSTPIMWFDVYVKITFLCFKSEYNISDTLCTFSY